MSLWGGAVPPAAVASAPPDLITTIRIRVLALLTRRGIIEDDTDQLVLLPDELAEDEPVLAQVTAAAATGLPPAGPERRDREPLRVARTPGASISGPLSPRARARHPSGRRRGATGTQAGVL